MKCLVTGGAGFIGSHLSSILVRQGHTVTILDDLSTGHLSNVEDIPHIFVRGDVSDRSTVVDVVKENEAVFHLAAIASVPKTLEDPIRSHQVNLEGTLNVLEACRQTGCKRVIFASSAAVYGLEPLTPTDESSAPRPGSPYALEKLSSELYLKLYSELFSLDTVALRFFNVYGPKQDPSSPYSGVLSLFKKRLSQGDPVTIYGDGEQSRDFVYVEDVARALLCALTVPNPRGLVCNVARGQSVTINEIYTMMSRAMKLDPVPKPTYQPARQGDPRVSLASITRAEEALGFKAKVSLEEGLRLYVQS